MLTNKDCGDMTIREAIQILDDEIQKTSDIDTKARLELAMRTFEDFRFQQNMKHYYHTCYANL